ncbi:XisH family protein [Sphaerospermopsis sp. LEGE 00249]|uniref:XisH family protein n=1 Tax=Sphaerospermopsis sp. LEGE 00249 TaxID=1380707 RepID=UPI002101F1D2|nr:XisH family protein [Sphaerospermopsis sp. LEGE 00249]
MAKSFTPELKKILDGAGCYFERSGKGDHEIWYSPLTQRTAERILAAEKTGKKIAVEIKSFLGASEVTEFHLALGQCLNYRSALKLTEPERMLYLAIPVDDRLLGMRSLIYHL